MRLKKGISILIMSVVVTILSVGCNGEQGKQEPISTPEVQVTVTDSIYNTAFEAYIEDISELGIIVNSPTQEQLGSLDQLETYKHAETDETLLIIPKYNGSKVTISSVAYVDNHFIAKEVLYTKEGTSSGYGVLVNAVRPEGIPEIMVTVGYKNKSIDYIVGANGKDGNIEIEYLSLETDENAESIGIDTIEPIQDSTYLQGLTLFDAFKIDFNQDGKEESVEVYCQGEIDETGKYFLDDGQEWALVVRKGDRIYPIVERSYIQLGGLSYTLYTDYNDNEKLHLLIQYKAGAELRTYDATYDIASDGFTREVSYEASNISIIKEWQ